MNPILTSARDAWLAASQFRARRNRAKRYTYGDQWSDIVRDNQGNYISEADYIAKGGKKPLTNNMIRQIVKVIVGRYRSMCAENTVYTDPADRTVIDDNDLIELDCRMLEEFLISGVAIQRVARSESPFTPPVTVDNVDPRSFFVNHFRDPRGRDIKLIGMLHDLTLPEILARFAPSNPSLAQRISRIYSAATADTFSCRPQLGLMAPADDDFFSSPDGLCRIIEVWSLDCRHNLLTAKPKKTAPKIQFLWHCRWFAPDGTIIASYDSPFPHRSHPFALKFYPLTDGEVHSFVDDVIDQQRGINRLIVLIDHVIGAAAKGVLLFPVEQKPKETSWAEVADTWAQTNGILPITGRGPNLPQQVVSPTSELGAYNLLSLQMKLFDNISGVSDALAGRDISPSVSNSRYQTQLLNSAISLADLLDTFTAFCRLRNLKAQNS